MAHVYRNSAVVIEGIRYVLDNLGTIARTVHEGEADVLLRIGHTHTQHLSAMIVSLDGLYGAALDGLRTYAEELEPPLPTSIEDAPEGWDTAELPF